jgi:uncharacterized protein with NRDE domain
MCLLLVAYNCHPRYQVILASNRDEFYSRSTEPLSVRGTDRKVLCGLDLEGGGTWLAAAQSGRIAALTNVREPERMRAEAPSRGLLVSGCAASDNPLDRFLAALMHQAAAYNGFNLIAADSSGLYYCSNRTGSIQKLDSGLYGLSNHGLDTPWPKLTRAKKLFAGILDRPGPIHDESLFAMLRDDEHPPDHMLPDTGVGPLWERILSPIFIHSDIYGTRTSSLVFLDHIGTLRFIERTHALPGSCDSPGTREFSFETQNTGRVDSMSRTNIQET